MKVATAILVVAAALLVGGCGGGGGSTPDGGAEGGAVATAELAQKIGLVSNGEGEYRLGGCTATALLVSPTQVKAARAAGKDVVTDPTGHYGVEIEDRTRCSQVMKGAVAVLNVP